MKKKLVPIIIAVVLVIAVVTGIVLANVIGKGDDKTGTSLAASGEQNQTASGAVDGDASDATSVNLLPDDVSVPEIGEDTSAPEVDIDNENFNEGDFYNYFLDFSLFFHDELANVSDLREISSEYWLTAAYVANYVWSMDYAAGIEYPYDDEDHVLIPLSRLTEASEEFFGFKYDFAELTEGTYASMVQNGSFVVPNGFDLMGSPYADLSTAKLSVKGNTITVDATIVQPDLDNENPEKYGKFRYTFTLDESQTLTKYRLVSIKAI